MTRHYYNENDPFAAAWLERLIQAEQIPPGHVDSRSIVEVQPTDLEGFTQCHFFAGIAGWPLALAMAGWPVDRPVWTASCPCQPLSSAGKQQGHVDERHLWPTFYRLLAERRPATLLGEQVANKDGREWFAAVRADLKGLGYACGAADLCAASAGAPHIRQRLFFLAHTSRPTRQQDARSAPRDETPDGREGRQQRRPDRHHRPPSDGQDGSMADAPCDRLHEQPGSGPETGAGARGLGIDEPDHRRGDGAGPMEHPAEPGRERQPDGRSPLHPQQPTAERTGRDAGALADAAESGRREQPIRDAGARRRPAAEPRRLRDPCDGAHTNSPGPRAGDSATALDRNPWADLAWIPCRDGKARPTQPGLFPLAHGVSARVGRLRAYGNAIVPQVAATFIEGVMEIL